MGEKLFELCEHQLLSILEDADISTTRIVDDATAAAANSAELCEKLMQFAESNSQDKVVCQNLGAKLDAVLNGMQYFDEFSQRIQHIKEIIKLIKWASDREADFKDPKRSEELLDDISSILSIRSEFEVFEKIFPERQKIDAGEMVELF